MFEDMIESVSILERIKLLFVKAQYDFDYEDKTIIKYKKMKDKIYILQIIMLWKEYIICNNQYLI